MSIRLKDTIYDNIDKLSSSAGGTTQPIYFNNGKPTNCSYTLGCSVPSDAKFTDTNTTYSQATSTTLGLVKIGYSTSGKNYAVQLNSSGQMYVNVPWTDNDTKYTLPESTTSALGGIKIAKDNASYTVTTNTSSISANITSGKYYGVELDKNGKAFVYVPWTDNNTIYTLPESTTSALGGIKIAKDNASYTVTTNTSSISSNVTSGKYYGVELDKNGKAFVYVPWTDTNTDTNTTYSAGSGLSLSGTTFNHASTVTAGTAGTSSATSGSTIAIPYVTVNATGHVTGYGTHTHTISSTDHTHTTYVAKTGDVMSGPLRFEKPTTETNNYNEGIRFNLGGKALWAGFIIGASAGTSSGTQEGAYSFLVNNKTLQIRHQDTNFMTVNTSCDVQWNPGLFSIVTGQTECGIRFRIASNSGDFVGRYSNYVSLYNANNPDSEIKIHDSNNEITIGKYNQKNRLIVNGIGDSAGYYSQIYAAAPNEASITFSNDKLQSDPNFFTVGMTHSDNVFWVYSGKKPGRILIGDGNGYIKIPNRLIIGADATPSYPLQVAGEGYFSNTLYINKSSTACALSLVHASSSYPWCWQRFVSNNQEWHVGVCSDSSSGTNRLNAGAFEIRGRGQSDEGIFIRQETSSFGKLVVANNSNTETSIGYLNTNHSNTYPVWTVGCGIGTGVQTFGWWYQPANGSGGDCKMYLDNGGNLFLDGTIYIGGQAITFTT